MAISGNFTGGRVVTRGNNLQFSININPTINGRTSTAADLDQQMKGLAGIILDQVAFFSSERQQRNLVSNIEARFQGVVYKQLKLMGQRIAQQAIGLKATDTLSQKAPLRTNAVSNPRRTTQGPAIRLGLEGGIANAMRNLASPFSIQPLWAARDPKYLARKKKRTGNTNWFQDTGELKRALTNTSTYYQSFGPVRVTFQKEAVSTPDAYTKVSSILPGGRVGKNILIGTIKVSALTRITESMLNDPGAQPSPWDSGLFDTMYEADKLLGTRYKYRPFLEHFLSYYITRSIPNAVFREIEKSLSLG